MVRSLSFAAILAVLLIHSSAYAGFGDMLKKKAGGGGTSGATSGGKSASYQKMEQTREKNKELANELNTFVKGLVGTPYKDAIGKVTRKSGTQYSKSDKFKTRWLNVKYDPEGCVIIEIAQGPDGNVNSASAWGVYPNEAGNCQEAYGS